MIQTNKNARTFLLLISGFACFLLVLTTFDPHVVYAVPSAGQITSKVSNGMRVIQTILSSAVVGLGILASLWIILKKMPSADDPHEKNQIFKSVGTIMGLVVLAGALVWIVPFVYGLLS
ncbi:CagC family type IV secretion system protein [Listeria booriae]|uniref:CagC family type IV secretion system protein n=1 Tax=Listeria booriae TaxID=1552123 RepID=UPI001627DD24|nr:CagC family type IV secretion system protein [Listeria booriae]MBC1248119.1 conjugal transfer protein [Listeria booriae]MBC1287309.1 conjugal transfer protein [Listeria booriae]